MEGLQSILREAYSCDQGANLSMTHTCLSLTLDPQSFLASVVQLGLSRDAQLTDGCLQLLVEDSPLYAVDTIGE